MAAFAADLDEPHTRHRHGDDVNDMSLIKVSQDYERGGTQKDHYTAEDVVLVACPFCGSNDRSHVYTEHGALVVAQCRSCSLLYTSPRVKAPEQVYWGSG